MSISDLLITQLPLNSLPSSLYSYQPGKTPLSTLPVVFPVIVGYVAFVLSLREFMRDRKPIRLNTALQMHNAFLTVASGLLLVLMLEEALPRCGSMACSTECVHRVCGHPKWSSMS